MQLPLSSLVTPMNGRKKSLDCVTCVLVRLEMYPNTRWNIFDIGGR